MYPTASPGLIVKETSSTAVTTRFVRRSRPAACRTTSAA
jgi:hypothetical protein